MTVLETLALLNLIAVVIINGKPLIITFYRHFARRFAATAKYGYFVRRHQCNDKEITGPYYRTGISSDYKSLRDSRACGNRPAPLVHHYMIFPPAVKRKLANKTGETAGLVISC